MSKFLLFCFLFFAVFCVLFSPLVSSSEEDSSSSTPDSEDVETYDEESSEEETVVDDVEPQTGLDDAGSLIGSLEPHPDISLTVYFPQHTDKRFPQGELITALVGISNSGPEAFNISYSGGHLHSAIDFGYYVQNFSVYHVDTVVHPGTESTVEYWFKADTNLEPVDFLFSGWLIYNTSNGNIYKSNFANETVWLVEPASEFDLKSAFTWLILLGAFGATGYAIYINSPVAKKKSKRSKTENQGPKVEWTPTQVYTPSSNNKVVQKKRGGSNKKPSDSKKKDQSASSSDNNAQ